MNDMENYLYSLYEAQKNKLDELMAMLQDEKTALSNRDIEAIDNIARNKKVMLDAIADIDTERQAYMEEAMAEHGEFVFKSSAFNQIKEQIQLLLDQCRHMNQINGGIIELGQFFTEKMINILYDLPMEQATYDTSGKEQRPDSQHSIAKI